MSLSESVRFRPITVPLPVFSVRYHLNFPLPQILSVTTWSFRYHRFRLLPFEFSVTTKFCPLPQFVQYKHSCAKHSLEIRGPIGPQSSSQLIGYDHLTNMVLVTGIKSNKTVSPEQLCAGHKITGTRPHFYEYVGEDKQMKFHKIRQVLIHKI